MILDGIVDIPTRWSEHNPYKEIEMLFWLESIFVVIFIMHYTESFTGDQDAISQQVMLYIFESTCN